MKLKSLTNTFFITNTPSIDDANEFERHDLDHQYSFHWRSWRVWQTRSFSPILPPLMKLIFWQTGSWSPILPPFKELMSLGGIFLITNTPSVYEAAEFDRHVLHHQYSLHWWSWRVLQTRSSSPILPPLMKVKSLTPGSWSPKFPPLNKLKSLADTFLITSTPSIEEAVQFDRHVLDHQSSLLWRNWRVWQTRSWSPILPPLKKLKSLTDTFLTTNTPSIRGTNEFERHVLDHHYTLRLWSWRVWQTRSASPILPPLMKLKSLTVTFLITNTPFIEEVEESDRRDLDQQYTIHWRSWRIWQARSWSQIIPPIKKLESLTDTFLITNTPSINEADILTNTFLITNAASTEETEEFDRQVLDHQYSLRWRNSKIWQTRSWSPILPTIKKLEALTDTLLITNTPSSNEAEILTARILITNTPSIYEAEEFDRHVLAHQHSLQ